MISVTDRVLRVQADPGESNAIEVTPDGSDVLVRDVKPRVLDGSCRVLGARVVACSADAVARIEVRAGDKDDSVRIADELPSILIGDSGDDRLSGGSSVDIIRGGEGDDVLDGGAGADDLAGASGSDLVAGGLGADVLRGGSGEDDLNGEEGDDSLLAGSGDDLLDGGAGIDTLRGELGTDTLRGGEGGDAHDGGPGNDSVFADDGEADTVACGPGADAAQVDPADALSECEKLRGPGGSVVRATPAPTPAPTVLTPLTPFPVVRIVGAVSGSRTRLSRVLVNAPAGARVLSRCSGPGCPYKRRVSTLPRGGGRVALRALQRGFRAGVTLEIFVTREGRIGKYAKFVTRRRRAPARTDSCLRAESLRSVPCGT